MQTINVKSIAMILCFALLLSCSKDQISDHEMMWQCHNAENWDSISVLEKISGEWTWDFTDCSAFRGSGPGFGDSNTVEFIEDRVRIRDNNEVTFEGSWRLSKANDAGLHLLETEPELSTLKGLVLFCEDRLELNKSHRQECDTYFKRM